MGEAFLMGRSGGGTNGTLPTMPTDFKAATGHMQATLTFTVPTANYAGAIIVRKQDSAPTGVRDGVILQADSGNVIDTGLINEQLYYWRLFPFNDRKQYQTDLKGAVVNGTPTELPNFTYTGSYSRVDSYHPTNGSPRYFVELKTSGSFSLSSPSIADVFLVGGGESGANGPTSVYGAGGGGGGGYTKTVKNMSLSSNVNVIIGAGGSAPESTPSHIGDAGSGTSFGAQSVLGGGYTPRTSYLNGGDGGSGGGAYESDGGFNGSNGMPKYADDNGIGQGTTTRPFNGDVVPFTTMYYAGGGGGGRRDYGYPIGIGGTGGGGSGGYGDLMNGENGTPNTGGGGGGGGGLWSEGGAGGSGIVIVRVGDWSE